ncbi:hypothetical protein TRVA0_018S00254 [Trichomonascus vanleenenianus]|uniref:DNA-directed RNA polymerase III subunit C53 n=1 Tax=Trichomonascus vanleenenianus TaxID=2268995 RepID=UPI003ECB9CE7
MSDANKRLDSLTRPASSSRARFMPKSVARRTKEERDKSAPVNKPEIKEEKPAHLQASGSGTRGGRGGRGGARGGRGRGGKFQMVTTAAAAGPLAAPTTAGGDRRAFAPAMEIRSQSPGYDMAAFRIKSETPEGTPENENRYDMNESAAMEGELGQYFPIRLQKLDLNAEQPEEEERIRQDKQELVEELSGKLGHRLYFFQFPVIMPQFELPEGELDPEGLAGKLRVHKSGRVTMKIGDIVMDVSQGADCNFLQDVVIMDKEEKKAYQIGQIAKRLVVSPDVNSIL